MADTRTPTTDAMIGPTGRPIPADADGPARREPAVHFDFAFDPAFRVAGFAFGVVPGRTGVDVDDERLTARFGPWVVSTPLANVLTAHVTGPYTMAKVIGGPRLSLADRGLTFATNAREGVCIRFVRPVAGIDPVGRIGHPGLTVTVSEPAALAELLDRASHLHGAAPVDEPIPIDEVVREANHDLTALTAAELRTRARELGVSGVGKLRKAELVELLRAPEFPAT